MRLQGTPLRLRCTFRRDLKSAQRKSDVIPPANTLAYQSRAKTKADTTISSAGSACSATAYQNISRTNWVSTSALLCDIAQLAICRAAHLGRGREYVIGTRCAGPGAGFGGVAVAILGATNCCCAHELVIRAELIVSYMFYVNEGREGRGGWWGERI